MNKKYWLRGGILGGIVFLIVFILLFNLSQIPGSFFDNLYLITFFPVYICLLMLYGVGNHINFFVQLLLATSQGFIIGIFLGWLYGKIKNRNKVN